MRALGTVILLWGWVACSWAWGWGHGRVSSGMDGDASTGMPFVSQQWDEGRRPRRG